MKKILSAILCVCMIFALCACGEQPAGVSQNTPEPAPESGAPAGSEAPLPLCRTVRSSANV